MKLSGCSGNRSRPGSQAKRQRRPLAYHQLNSGLAPTQAEEELNVVSGLVGHYKLNQLGMENAYLKSSTPRFKRRNERHSGKSANRD